VEISIDSLNPTNLEVNQNFKDTWHAAIGLQHAFTDCWLVNMGIGYDTKYQNPDKVLPSSPSNAALRIGLGTRYAYRDDLDFGMAFEYIAGGNLGINNHNPIKGDVVGDFDNVTVYFISLNASWKCI
jgi:long-chain fatty acid transport protein